MNTNNGVRKKTKGIAKKSQPKYKFKKVRSINTWIISSLLFILNSCFESNAIYFDIKDQLIKSCNHKGINRLYIKNDSIPEIYRLVWNDSRSTSPKNINLTAVEKSYDIYEGWNNKLVSAKDFKLKPLSKYIIERVQGDASSYKITVWTNVTGTVVKAIPDNCDH